MSISYLAASAILITFSAYLMELNYPINYLFIIPLILIILLNFNRRYTTAILSAFGYLLALNYFKNIEFVEIGFPQFLQPIHHIDVLNYGGGHNYMVFHNIINIIFLQFPPISYLIAPIYFIFIYTSTILMLSQMDGQYEREAIAAISVILPLFGFNLSVAFAQLSYYYLLKGRAAPSLVLLFISTLFGSRGLILIGLLYAIELLRRFRLKYRVLFMLLIAISLVLMSNYIFGNIKIITSFLGSVHGLTLGGLVDRVIGFLTRSRLQPPPSFALAVISYVVAVVLGVYLAIEKRLYAHLFAIIAMLAVFSVLFIGRIYIFENPASDLPYYFLYPAVILSIYIMALAKVARWVLLALFLMISIAVVPTPSYVAYYENTFNNYQEYYALLHFIYTYGDNIHILYDYGSYQYSSYITNGIMLQPWQSPLSFSGYYYVYSSWLDKLRMFYALPYVQNSLIKIAKGDVVYSSDYLISPVP